MIEEQAIVIQTRGSHVEIQMQRQSACNHCDLNRGCGTGAIGRLLGHRSKPLIIETSLPLKKGDWVLLGMPDSSFLRASLLIYGLPLFSLICSAILGQLLFSGSEALVLVFALAGFVVGLVYSAKKAKSRFSAEFSPRILQINSEPTDSF